MLTPIAPVGQWITPGLSQAMLIKGGNLLLVSGLVATNPEGGIVGDDIESQLLQIFEKHGRDASGCGHRLSFCRTTDLLYRELPTQPPPGDPLRS